MAYLSRNLGFKIVLYTIALTIAGFLSNISTALANPQGGIDAGGGDAVRLDIIASIETINKDSPKWKSLTETDPSLAGKLQELINGKNENNQPTLIISIEEKVALEDKILRSGKFRKSFMHETLKRIVNEITFSRSAWLAAKDDNLRKIGIVLHELLGLLGVEGTDDYHVSRNVLNEMRAMAGLPKHETWVCQVSFSCDNKEFRDRPPSSGAVRGKGTAIFSIKSRQLVIESATSNSCLRHGRHVIMNEVGTYKPFTKKFAQIHDMREIESNSSLGIEWGQTIRPLSYKGQAFSQMQAFYDRSESKGSFKQFLFDQLLDNSGGSVGEKFSVFSASLSNCQLQK